MVRTLLRVTVLFVLCFIATTRTLATAPYSHTEPAFIINNTNAVLQGAVTPNGQDTVAWFEWGFDETYGASTPPIAAGSGNQLQWITNTIAPIIAQQTYHVCCVASNASGVTRGADKVFAVGKRAWAWGYNQFFPNNGQPPLPYGLSNAVAIAADSSHAIALRSDGTVQAWGIDNFTGQLNVPPTLRSAIAICVGHNTDFGLQQDGTITLWGYHPTYLDPPIGLSNVVAFAVGDQHVLALQRDGSLTAFGTNTAGQLNVPPDATNIVAISAASGSCLVLRDDGKVFAWGAYYYGTTNIPTSISNVVDVSAANTLDWVLKTNGTIAAWGSDFYNTLIPPPKATNVQSICAGEHDVLVRTHDGKIIVWGDNSLSQTNVPRQLTNVVALAYSDNQCLALGNNIAPLAYPKWEYVALNDEDVITLEGSDANNDALTFRISKPPVYGTLYQYNAGAHGAAITSVGTAVTDPGGHVIFVPGADALGRAYDNFEFIADDGADVSAPARVQIGGVPFVETQAAWSITETNAVLTGMVTPNFPAMAWFEWGTNHGFQNQSPPQFFSGGSNVVWITNAIDGLAPYLAYQFRVVASNSAGVTVGAEQLFGVARRGWFWNYSGYPVPGLSNAVAIAPGYGSVLALKPDGTVSAFVTGQVAGTGTATNIPAGLSNVVAISAGYNTSLALKSDGTLVGWGDMVVPAGISNVVAIACNNLNVALQRDGTLVGWGNSIDLPPPLNNIVAFTTAGVAVRNNGSLAAWGDTYNGRKNVPMVTNAIAVGAGFGQRVALTRDYNVLMWATNIGVKLPPDATNIVSIASDDYFDVGLRLDGSVVAWGYANSNETNVPPDISSAIAVGAKNGTGFALTANRPPKVSGSFTSSLAAGDVLVRLTGADPDNDSLTFKVGTLPLLGTLYQFDGIGRGAAIVTANTPIIDANARFVYVPGSPSSTTPYDTFQVVANDGANDSAPAPVAIQGTAYAHTLPATAITDTNALLSAMVTPNLLDTTTWFEWGPDTNYGNQTTAIDAGFGSHIFFLTNTIDSTGLQTIHFRVAASNVSGFYYGADQVFGYSRRAWAWGNGFYGQTNIPKGLSNCVAIASGVNHSLALTTKGIVRGWGNTSYNESTPPVGLSNVVAIAAAVIHSAAITSNHTVVAWGNGTFGETNVPPTLSNVVSVAVGSAHMLALKSDGTVVHWGYSWPTLTNIPPSATNIVAVAAGDNVSIALRDDGRVVAWGNNVVTNLPANLSDVVAISARSSSCIALKRDGTVTVWGTTISNAPPTLTNIVAVSAGLQGMAIDNAALVKVWGYQFSSMMNVPTGLTNTIAIAAGDVHAAALGNNVAPVAASQIVNSVANTESVIALSATDINNDICTLRITSLPASGTLFQYATDGHGSPITAIDTKVTDASNRVVFASQTDAFGTPYDAFQFVANDATVDSGPAVITINVAANPLAYTEPATLITASNALLNAMVVPRLPTSAWFEWGNDTNYGQQSAMFTLNSSSRCVFLTNLINGLTALQPYHFRCVASNAAGISYGADQYFTFGKRISGFSSNPAAGSVTMYPPTGLSNIVGVAAGSSHALVVDSDGRVSLWANSNAVNGQTNFITPLTNVMAIAAGPNSSMIMYRNGTVATAPYTVVPLAATNVCSIACGQSHYMALRRDGTVVAWGANTYGQTNVPSTLNNVVAIAAGYGSSTALRADGTVMAWGAGYNVNSAGITPPVGLSNVIAIASGGDGTMAMKQDGSVMSWGTLSGPLTNVPPAAAIAVGGTANSTWPFVVSKDGTLWQRASTSSYNTVNMALFPGYSNIAAICDGPTFGLVLSDNIAPSAFPSTYTVAPANDLRIFLKNNARDLNGDAFSSTITSLPASGTLYLADGTQRGQAITTTNTVVPYPGGIIYAPNTFGAPTDNFAFTFFVNDGQYDSGPATITINVRTNLQALTYPATSITSSNATLNGTVVANATPTGAWFELGTNVFTFTTNAAIVVQAATNAIPWSTMVSNLSPLTTYYYRAVATNSFSTNIGSLLSFTTSVPPIRISSAVLGPYQLQLNFGGLSNATYSVYSAADPAGQWHWEGSAVQVAPGLFQFSAPMWDGQRMRFYQIIYP